MYLSWHVANTISSLTAILIINRCPPPVLGHHPFLVFILFDLIFSLKNQLSDKEKLGGKLSDDEQSKIEEIINEKIKWLEDNTVS